MRQGAVVRACDRAGALRAPSILGMLLCLAAWALPGDAAAAECPLDIISATVEHGGNVTIDIPPCRASAMAMGAAPTCGSATFVDAFQTQILYDHDEIACPDATGDQFEFFGNDFATIIVQVTINAAGGGGGGGGGGGDPPPPVALPGATVGVAYAETIGPAGPVTYTVTAGVLPAGLLLDSGNATISGTPTEAGSFAFTITADDGVMPVPADFTLVVGAPTIVVDSAGTYEVDQGVAVGDMMQASGGTAPYTFAVTSGTLPPGMSLAADGLFSGTFTTAGSYTFEVTATDSSTGTGAPFTGTASFTFNIAATAPTITVSPATLDDGRVGDAYEATLTAGGGTAPYTFAVTAGALPPGLGLDPSGSLTGTPTTAGTFNVTVTATDDNDNTGSRPYAITIAAAALSATITASSDVTCAAGSDGSATVTPSGGTAPYAYLWSNGATTATIAGVAAGTYDVTVTDDNGGEGSAQAVIAEPDPLAFTLVALPGGTAGEAYAQVLAASGGTGGRTYTLSGTLPDGLALVGDTISGTPTAPGTSTFDIQVQDDNTCSTTQEYTITIAGAPPTISLPVLTLPDGYAGTPGHYGLDYSVTLAASGGTAPYTYAVTDGRLPYGLRLDAGTGAVSGMPTGIGTFDFTITATDSNGVEGTGVYSIEVLRGLAEPTTSTTDATCAFAADGTATVTTSGGATPYRYLWATGETTASIGGLEAGSYSVSVTDANGINATTNAVVGEPGQLVLDTQLNGGVVGEPYSVPLVVGGGTGTKTISIDGALPLGISLVGSELKGTPMAAGTSEFDVVIEDANACTAAFTISITIEPRPVITLDPAGTGLPIFRVGVPATVQLVASGGTPPYTFPAGSLPGGLTLSDTGLISGVPDTVIDTWFVIEATDASGFRGGNNYRFQVVGPLTAEVVVENAVTCPGGSDGRARVKHEGGIANFLYAWSNGETTSTAVALAAGEVSVDVTSGDGQTATATATIDQPDALVIAPLPGTVAGSSFSHALSVSGGTGAASVSFPRGLPPGFAFSDGVLSGTPAAPGAVTFDATITDSLGCAAQQQLTLDVTTAPPVANDDRVTTPFATPVTIPVTENDTGEIEAITIVLGARNGTVRVSGLVVQYTPDSGFNGTDTFTYTASGPGGTSGEATVDVTILRPPLDVSVDVQHVTCPAGTDGSATATVRNATDPVSITWSDGQSGAKATGLSAGRYTVTAASDDRTASADVDILEPDPLLVQEFGEPATAGVPFNHVFVVQGGTGTSTVSFPDGLPDGFAYSGGTLTGTPARVGALVFDASVVDAAGCPAMQRLVLDVVWPERSIVVDDTATTVAGRPVIIDVSANDITRQTKILLFSDPQHGSVSASGLLATYVPDDGFVGKDTFAYYYSDSDLGIVTVTVGPAPIPAPVANDDAVATTPGNPLTIAVTANDTGEIEAIELVSGPAAGAVAVGELVVDYLPPDDFSGVDTFTYIAKGPGGNSAPATVTITVSRPPAAPPVAVDDVASTRYWTEARIAVTSNDEGEIDSVAIARHPSNGVAKTDGLEVVYFPNQGFHGEDTLTYTASGPGGVSGPAVITVKVDEPMFSVGPATLPRATAGKPYSGQLTASGSEGLFRFYVTGLPAGLDVNEFTGKVSGTPTQAGTFSLAVTVTDSSGASGTGTVTLVVEAVAPTAKPADVLAFQGTTVKLPLLHNLVGSTSDVTAATILDMSPADAGSLSDPAPPDFYPTLALATTFLGEVKIRYTLSSAYATSEPITLVVKVGARQTIDLAPIELNTSVVRTNAMRLAFVDAVRQQLAHAMNIDVSRITISNSVVLLSPGPTCGPLDWHTPGSPCRQPMLGDEQMPVRAPDVVKSDRDAGNPPPPFRLWTSGTVRFGDQDASGGGDGFEFETSGVSIGADKRVADGLLVGAALGYGRDVTDIGTNGTRSRTTSVNLALYGRYQPGDVFVDAILGRQQLDFDFVRHLEQTDGRVRGERDGHQWFGSLGMGYEFDGARLDVSPYGRVDMASGQLDAYTETGDPIWALAYEDMSLRSTTLNLGVRMDGQVARDWGVFSPSLDLEYQRDVDDGSVARIRYADLPDGPLYRVEVPGFDRNRFMLGVGFGLQTRKHLGLQLQWRTLLGNSQRSDNSIHVNVSKRF